MAFGSASTTISSAFGDFFYTTTKQTLSSADKFINMAALRSYLLSELVKGKSGTRIFQNGSAIQDFIITGTGTTRQRYDPNQEAAPSNPQVLKPWSIPWTFTIDNMTWTDHEVILQAGGRDRDSQFAVFKRIAEAKLSRLMASMANGTEADLWAVPDKTKMEATTGSNPQEPYSIPCFLNEFTDMLPSSAHPNGAWTTKQGLDPTTDTYWVGVKKTYSDYLGSLAVGSDYDLFQAFEQAIIATEYDAMPLGEQYAPSDSGPDIIVTSEAGKALVMAGLRRANNYTRYGAQDAAYPSPMFSGRKVISCQSLSTAAIYPAHATTPNSATSLVAENDATVLGLNGTLTAATTAPRFYGLNKDMMAMIWHSERYFMPSDTVEPYKQPFTHTRYYDTWANLAFRSLRNHWIVSPGQALL